MFKKIFDEIAERFSTEKMLSDDRIYDGDITVKKEIEDFAQERLPEGAVVFSSRPINCDCEFVVWDVAIMRIEDGKIVTESCHFETEC